MKRILVLSLMSLFIFVIAACKATTDYSGTYTGYSWAGEANGVSFDEATQYIETTLTLGADGTILEASIDFMVFRNGTWVSRLNTDATVSIDYSVDPTQAIVGENAANGESMFTIETVDLMSFYTYGVDADGTIAIGIVCPVTRYLFEMKLPADFDFTTPVEALTIANGHLVPTILTSNFGLARVSDWDRYENRSIFTIHHWSHVVNEYGVFEGIDNDSTTAELLEALGITFTNDQANPLEAEYGFFGIGGWAGNYAAIENFLIGKNATELTSLIDWSIEEYALNIDENNFFGRDTITGATRTVQNSVDTIAGATVRISREATSFQRALVEAGIIDESDVIIGRF
ncbi:MAG: hypothetical protein ACNA7U_07865 [Candidatus Izemoplasmataceae bacterium]